MLKNKDKALLSRQLVTLKDDVPIKDDPTSFIIKEINKDNLYNFLREMEFNRLLSMAISFYGEDNTIDSNFDTKKVKSSKIDNKLYKSILSEKDLDKLIDILNTKPFISIDTETSSLNPLEAELIGISFSYASNEAYENFKYSSGTSRK